MSNVVHIATEWWGIGATIFSGIITVVATMGAVIINTKSVLLNMSTEERSFYETYNAISLLRGQESVIVRLMDQNQYIKILEMNKEKKPSLLDFYCKIEYSTLAHQRITYISNKN